MKFERLDAIDTIILKHLIDDGRISYAELGRVVNLTRAAVRDRINSLVEKGIIEKFTVIINPRKAGKTLSVFLDIDVKWEDLFDVANALAGFENVTNVYQMSGKPGLHVHALVDDQKELEEYIERVRCIEGIASIKAEILIKRFKERGSMLV